MARVAEWRRQSRRQLGHVTLGSSSRGGSLLLAPEGLLENVHPFLEAEVRVGKLLIRDGPFKLGLVDHELRQVGTHNQRGYFQNKQS